MYKVWLQCGHFWYEYGTIIKQDSPSTLTWDPNGTDGFGAPVLGRACFACASKPQYTLEQLSGWGGIGGVIPIIHIQGEYEEVETDE